MRSGTMASTARLYKETKGKLAVVTFFQGQRKLTYSGLSIDQAMQEIRVKTKRGLHAIICVNLPHCEIGNKIEDYKEFMW